MTNSPAPFPITVFDEVTSTNDAILELGSGDAPEGTTHLALTQTLGRGRSDHRWWSPPGAGVWMSTLLRPRVERALWAGLSLLAGVAARSALESIGVPNTQLFWPNDLEVGRKKLGGILGEVRSSGKKAWLAMGIGINIDLREAKAHKYLPADVAANATSILECVESGAVTTISPVEIAHHILEKFWPLYERFHAKESIAALAGTQLAHIGHDVEIRLGDRPPWRAIVKGLGERGELLVQPSGDPAEPVVSLTGGEVVYGEEEQT